jgi:hypothetical protein
MADNTLLMGPQAASDPYSALHNIQARFGLGPDSAAGRERAEAARPKGPENRGIPELYSETGGQGDRLSGLNTRIVPTYKVDGDGRPTALAQNKNDVIGGPTTPKAPSTIDTTNALDVNRLGLTTSPFETSATKAISRATQASGSSPIGPGPLGFGELLGFLYDSDPNAGGTRWLGGGGASTAPGALVAAPSRINTGDAWAGSRTAPAGPGKQGLVTGTPGGGAPAAAPTPASSLADLFGGPPAPGTYSSNLQHNPNFGPAPGVHPHLNQFGMFD